MNSAAAQIPLNYVFSWRQNPKFKCKSGARLDFTADRRVAQEWSAQLRTRILLGGDEEDPLRCSRDATTSHNRQLPLHSDSCNYSGSETTCWCCEEWRACCWQPTCKQVDALVSLGGSGQVARIERKMLRKNRFSSQPFSKSIKLNWVTRESS